MNGAECLLRTLLAHGVDTCFMNPGTSEMQFVAALDRVPGMRGVLCLFEGVCSGAADGYARMLRRPAATLLHLGPGLGNALTNFHNARKARSPVVSIVGQHTTGHLLCDAPLSADIEAFARPVSSYVRSLERAEDMGEEAAATIRAACGPPGQMATLIVPADFSWSEAGEPGAARPLAAGAGTRGGVRARSGSNFERPGARRIAAGRRRAAGAGDCGGGTTGRRHGGARVRQPLRRQNGVRGRAVCAAAAGVLSGAGRGHAGGAETHHPGGKPAAGFLFRIPGAPELPGAGGLRFPRAGADRSETARRRWRHWSRNAAWHRFEPPAPDMSRPALPEGAGLTPDTIGLALASLLPEGSILSDEMVSSGEAVLRHLSSAASYDLLPITGGAIGQGLPVALGAALACPDRKVIALEADGSGMYTLQSLWTMARERLDVVTVILANRRYRILDIEMQRTGAGEMGRMANDMVDISRPDLDWVRLSEGMGVPATRATTADEFVAQFRAAVSEKGPALIEAVL